MYNVTLIKIIHDDNTEYSSRVDIKYLNKTIMFESKKNGEVGRPLQLL